jgi:hypothetical protein
LSLGDPFNQENAVRRRITFAAFAIVLTTVVRVEAASAPRQELSKTEQVLAEIMKLPAKERISKLVEGARKEGIMVFYAPDREELTNLRIQFFKEIHPGVIQKFQSPRVLPDIMIDRVLTEERAGKHQADVLWLQFHQVSVFQREGMLARYVAAEDSALPDDLKVAGIWRSLPSCTIRSLSQKKTRRKAGPISSILSGKES